MRIRVDDTVEVIAGNDRGTQGKVLKILPDEDRILVEGVNRVKKHVRRSQRNPRGGQLSKEMPVSLSNVLLVCSGCRKPAKMGARFWITEVKNVSARNVVPVMAKQLQRERATQNHKRSMK